MWEEKNSLISLYVYYINTNLKTKLNKFYGNLKKKNKKYPYETKLFVYFC